MKSPQKFLFKILFFAESVDELQISELWADRMNSLTRLGKYPSRGLTVSSPYSCLMGRAWGRSLDSLLYFLF